MYFIYMRMDINVKNVVIVTWKGGGNFGTCLQSYALIRKLKDIGYSVSFLGGPFSIGYALLSYIKYVVSLLGLMNIIYWVRELFFPLQERKRVRFQRKNYSEAKIFTKKQQIDFQNHVDCYVAGSDQIWNTYNEFNPFFFLDFAGETKRVAYASSIGTKGVKSEYKEKVRSLLSKFSHIGVRENDAVSLLSNLTGRNDIQQVLDPTFLLPPDDWSEMSKDAVIEVPIPERYILCYLIGKNDWYESQLKDVKRQTGISDIVILPAIENPNVTFHGATIYKDASPVEFVYLIQHANLVCTDSFHATALSINNSVPFVEFMRFKDSDELSQNSRIYDVLGRYNLMDRIYKKNSEAWLSEIDYQAVQDILAVDRKSSLDFLINAIET